MGLACVDRSIPVSSICVTAGVSMSWMNIESLGFVYLLSFTMKFTKAASIAIASSSM